MGIALKAENVSIRYITGDFKDIGLKEYTMRKLTGNYHVKEFMAVGGVSFELHEGEMLGIVGSNGAGKSTLLKAVAGIMEPTRGNITTHGEVVALLELGSGFDGDLTVKENAYLRGAMLGYTREFMDQTYDQIIDFAELRDFEDRPFKQLSSGMKSRLAFSIASLVKPDILILDEVLSVGDGAFRKKSEAKMREIISQGATTILVSHSIDQIREMCSKVLWLDHGRQVAFGETQEICDRYEAFLSTGGGRLLSEQIQLEKTEVEEEDSDNSDSILPEKAPRSLWRSFLRRVAVSLTLALFCAVLSSYVGQQFFINAQESQVTIRAQEGSGTVTFRGAYVDGGWVSPSDHVPDSGSWIYDPEQAVYTAVDNQAMTFQLPAGTERNLIFTVGPEEGVAEVEADGEIFTFDLRNESFVELGYAYALREKNPLGSTYTIAIAAAAFLLVFVFCFMGIKPEADTRRPERETWQDVLRCFCCFVIVLLHCTCNTYKEFGEDLIAWVPHMLMSSFTAFAVPCFFMISGANLLRREHGIREVWCRRIPAAAIPLIVWSVAYILCSGDVRPARFVAILFQGQQWHLWFMYSILGIYALLPLFSKLYQILGTKEKIYLLVLLLFIPTCLHDAEYLSNHYVEMPHFVFLWPDLGLFFWGMFLWEQREKLSKWVKWHPLLFIMGLFTTAACTVYASLRDGIPNQNFISCIGSIGVLGISSALFAFFVSRREELQRAGEKARSIFAAVAGISFGIYLIHLLVMQLCGWRWSNDGNFLHMCLAAVVYFSLSAAVCLCAKQVRGFEKIV